MTACGHTPYSAAPPILERRRTQRWRRQLMSAVGSSVEEVDPAPTANPAGHAKEATMKPGHFQGNSFDIVSAFQFVSFTYINYAYSIFLCALCTKSSSTPAEDPLKLEECHLAGKYLLQLLKMDLKPRDIITKKSLQNSMVIVMALGGSTNDVLHLIAIARSVVGLHSTLDDFQKVSDQVPFHVDLKPSGNARNNFPVTDPMVMLFNHRKHLI
ncbi:hypothetical protein C2845_PM03G32170 [Panicum miliaceum]|uniref:Dihydroxy-acid/6-phosphogluconate dehydratase N-terminal domain-containing protein n=1 Tax=Panicum miliaceum TaxID=4540 RepID=A0A3L6T8C5_PANMI|nr:hypothetical protein C2845_PM03G32170 [Panicum miliaceum]